MDSSMIPTFCIQDYERNLRLLGYSLGVSALTSMCLIVVSLRIYTRLIIVKAPWWDDLAIVIALVRSPKPLRPYQVPRAHIQILDFHISRLRPDAGSR